MTKFDYDAAQNSWEPSRDTALRHQLGLRPTFFAGLGEPGTNPDTRPCPRWCWAHGATEDDHEVDPARPMTAHHSTETHPSVLASLYRGSGDGRTVQAASIEPQLRQLGQGQATILVALRWWESHDKGRYDHERLRLSIEDAKELVKALNYLVDIAEGGQSA